MFKVAMTNINVANMVYIKISTCVLVLILYVQPVLSQNKEAISFIQSRTDTTFLLDLSRYYYYRDSALRKEAERIAHQLNWPVREERGDKVIELVRVTPDGYPLYYTSISNRTAARTTSAIMLHSSSNIGYNLEGQGMTIGMWDGGAVRESHESYSGRAIQKDGVTALSDHATHVGGTLISDGRANPASLGMAPRATLHAYNWGNDLSEMATAAAQGLLISNHSYGYITGWNGNNWYGIPGQREAAGFGVYNFASIDWDNIAYNAPYYLICKSVGNDNDDLHPPQGVTFYMNGNRSNPYIYDTIGSPDFSPYSDGNALGYDCIGWRGNAKNILTVGSVVDHPVYINPMGVQLSRFSSIGPTDDGRIKPDVVGNGQSLTSASSAGNRSYRSKSGTSMASPNVAGSLLLLQQYYMQTNDNIPMRAATLKALTIHTARECGPAPGPDYQFGWGLVNVEDAAHLIALDESHDSTIVELELSNGDTFIYHFFVSATDATIKATIAWNDPPGTGSGYSLNDPSLKLVNDIDLRVIDENDSVYFPYILYPNDPTLPADKGDNYRDNVEQVWQENISSGYYTIQITHKGTLASNQSVSLIHSVNGIVPLLSNPVVKLEAHPYSTYHEVRAVWDFSFTGKIILERWNDNRFVRISQHLIDDDQQRTFVFLDREVANDRKDYLYRIRLVSEDKPELFSNVARLQRYLLRPTVLMFPNPVVDRVQIHSSRPMKHTILSFSGRKVGKISSSQQDIDLSYLPSGMYVLQSTDLEGYSRLTPFSKQ